MKTNPLKISLKDKTWQKKVEKKLKFERINLDNPKGKERFEKVIKNAIKNK